MHSPGRTLRNSLFFLVLTVACAALPQLWAQASPKAWSNQSLSPDERAALVL